jgi:glycerophosphoryl diester phosphodiesterase
MKLIAHRGWAAGPSENTLEAFARAARHQRIAGVELDVNRAPGAGTLVVCHDPPRPGEVSLALDAALAFFAGTDLDLLIEIKQPGLASELIATLVRHDLAARAIVFGFERVARSFPWTQARPARLGVIATYPWAIGRMVRAYAPDVLLTGWDERAWTRVSFRGWWSAFSLDRLTRRYGLPVVVGVVQHQNDLDWLTRQNLYAAVADLDRGIALGAEPPTL